MLSRTREDTQIPFFSRFAQHCLTLVGPYLYGALVCRPNHHRPPPARPSAQQIARSGCERGAMKRGTGRRCSASLGPESEMSVAPSGRIPSSFPSSFRLRELLSRKEPKSSPELSSSQFRNWNSNSICSNEQSTVLVLKPEFVCHGFQIHSTDPRVIARTGTPRNSTAYSTDPT